MKSLELANDLWRVSKRKCWTQGNRKLLYSYTHTQTHTQRLHTHTHNGIFKKTKPEGHQNLYAKLNINLYCTLAFNVQTKSKILIHIIFANNSIRQEVGTACLFLSFCFSIVWMQVAPRLTRLVILYKSFYL